MKTRVFLVVVMVIMASFVSSAMAVGENEEPKMVGDGGLVFSGNRKMVMLMMMLPQPNCGGKGSFCAPWDPCCSGSFCIGPAGVGVCV